MNTPHETYGIPRKFECFICDDGVDDDGFFRRELEITLGKKMWIVPSDPLNCIFCKRKLMWGIVDYERNTLCENFTNTCRECSHHVLCTDADKNPGCERVECKYCEEQAATTSVGESKTL